jgi:hypothetical protein
MAPQLMLTGYQGLDKLHPNAEIPYKASKNHPLNAEEMEQSEVKKNTPSSKTLHTKK